MKQFSRIFALSLVVLAVHVNGDEDVDSTTDYTDYKEEENDQPTGLNATETDLLGLDAPGHIHVLPAGNGDAQEGSQIDLGFESLSKSCNAKGKTKKAFRNLNNGAVKEYNFEKRAAGTTMDELKKGGLDCLWFCSQQLSKLGSFQSQHSGSFQVTEGKNNAKKWMCRCFMGSNKATKQQTGRPSMVGKINCKDITLMEVTRHLPHFYSTARFEVKQ